MANKKKPLKKQKIRNSEYYDMQLVLDELYAASVKGQRFCNLVELIKHPENIKLAYRNIRKNSGSRTAGVDNKLTRVSMGYLTDTPSGRLKTTMVERVEQMEVPLAHIIPEMTSNLLVPIAIIIYLFVLDWRMALVSLITIPIGMLCYMAQMKEYPKKYGAVVQASKYMSATTVEYINGIEVIKAFNQSAASYGKFTQAVRQSVDLMLDWMKSTQGYSALMMTIWPAVLIGVLPVGCLFYMNGSLSAPDFITIAILSLGIMGPLVAAIFLTDDFSKIATITGEITAVLSESDLDRPSQRKNLKGLDISLRDVTFAYKDTQVLNGITLDIKQGTTTALVGPSGSGKWLHRPVP